MEGFSQYYATHYIIWANSAARERLGQSFQGNGKTVSPCFLMQIRHGLDCSGLAVQIVV